MLRVAFLGGGRMASHHRQAIAAAQPAARVVGVCDASLEQAQAFGAQAGCRAFTSLDAMFDDVHPDVVHVCTPPARHVEGALAALALGAHVYVEKPFALTLGDARALVDRARQQGKLVCAGHQLLCDPGFVALMAQGRTLGTILRVDSHFAFRPVGLPMMRTRPAAFAQMLIDILPHPLYTLVAALERFGRPGAPCVIDLLRAEPADLEVVLRCGDVTGRLTVSLRARPVASSLAMTGTKGTLTCDFMRSALLGAGNAGTEALEKILNPFAESAQTMARAAQSTARRLAGGSSYPGLTELIAGFYGAIEAGGGTPFLPAEHLLTTTDLLERMVTAIHVAVAERTPARPVPPPASAATPVFVVTGARGFLGAELARALSPVTGVGRGDWPGDPNVAGWISADLSRGLPPGALTGADVVVHAAAETAGDAAAHARNSVDATRQLLRAMHRDGARRLVLVSSFSVIRPPRRLSEWQDETTSRAENPAELGPYVWGKTMQEALVLTEAAALGIEVRVVRPAALLDRRDPELPGLAGRRLFGAWHLGLGRPRLPIAAIDVEVCADAIAWCARHFDQAPPIVNLFDPTIVTRRELLRHLGRSGWSGRMIWVPISFLSGALIAAQSALAVLSGKRPHPQAAWSILRPRRFDPRLSNALLHATRTNASSLNLDLLASGTAVLARAAVRSPAVSARETT